MTSNHLSRRTVLAGAGGAALLAGCSDTGGPTGSPSGGGTGAAKLQGAINVWGGVPPENGPQDLCDAFMKEYPGTTATYTRFVNDDPGNVKLDTALQGGADIDVFTSYDAALLAKRVDGGLAMDLTQRVAADKDLAAFKVDANPVQNLVFKGKLYAVPAQVSPTFVMANLDMLQAAGITPPDSWTFDEYAEVSRKLSKPGVFGSFSAPPVARATLGPNSTYSKDGTKSNFGDPAFRKELELAVQMQKDGSVMPMQTILAEKLVAYMQAPFLQGRVAMLTQQLFILRYINDLKNFPHTFKVIALPQPGPAKGDDGWNTGAVGDLLSVSEKSQNKELAWAMVAFWMKNAGKYMTRGGRLPSITGSETPDSLLNSLMGPDKDKLYDVASFRKILFERKNKLIIDTQFKAAAEVNQINTSLSQEVLLGTRTVDSYVTEVTKQADAAIAKAS